MADMIQDGVAWLADALTNNASRQVTYARGADQAAVQAAVGRTEFELDNGTGIIQRFESRDYLVKTADLVLGGAAALPEPGDRITETVGSTTYTYEVVAPVGQPCWRYADPYRTLLRIHTKHVGTQ